MSAKRIPIFFIILVGMLLAVFVPYQHATWGKNDFLPYWSASKTMLAGGNPYDANDLFQEQAAIRSDLDELSDVVPAWGPPWMMLLISPITWLEFEVATRIWIFCNVIILSLAFYLLWDMLFDPSDTKGLILTFGAGYLFGNTLKLIELGQFSAILLIGFVICIWCLERELYGWAGIALILLTIKPQITYLVLVVIFLWAIRNRKWRIIAGLLISGLCILFLLWVIFPNWFSEYLNAIISIPNFTIYSTTLGSFIEALFGIRIIKYSGLLLFPLSFPLSKYVSKGGWFTTLNLAVLISVPLAPYGFSYDHVLLLPAVVQMISWIWNKTLSVNCAWGVGCGIVICYGLVYILMSIASDLPYYWLIWPSIGLALIYLVAWWKNESILQTSEYY